MIIQGSVLTVASQLEASTNRRSLAAAFLRFCSTFTALKTNNNKQHTWIHMVHLILLFAVQSHILFSYPLLFRQLLTICLSDVAQKVDMELPGSFTDAQPVTCLYMFIHVLLNCRNMLKPYCCHFAPKRLQ